MILSIRATISPLSLTDELAQGRSHDALHTIAHPARTTEGESWDILRYFGARKSTRWIIYHRESQMPRSYSNYARIAISRYHLHHRWPRNPTSPIL